MWEAIVLIVIVLVIAGAFLPNVEDKRLKELAEDLGASYEDAPEIFTQDKHLHELTYEANGLSFSGCKSVCGKIDGHEYIIFHDESPDEGLAGREYVFVITHCKIPGIPHKLDLAYDTNTKQITYCESFCTQRPPESVATLLDNYRDLFEHNTIVMQDRGFLLICARWKDDLDYLKRIFELNTNLVTGNRE